MRKAIDSASTLNDSLGASSQGDLRGYDVKGQDMEKASKMEAS